MLKKMISLVMAILMAIGTCGMGYAEEGWTCPSCGSAASGNFCSVCGTKRPEDSVAGLTDGDCMLTLSVSYEENLFMAKYAVELFIDNQKVTTMPHGEGFSGQVPVTPGEHLIRFVKADDSGVEGSFSVHIDGDASFSCTIRSKTLSIAVDQVSFRHEQTNNTSPEGSTADAEADSDDQRMAPEAAMNEAFSGPVRLDLVIDFKENMMLSRYDVDLYLDDVFVATLPHGIGYQGTFGVTGGVHVLTFRKSGDKTIKGVSQFNVEEDTSFSCSIECKNNKIKVSGEMIGDSKKSTPITKEEYMAACKTLEYRDVERNPDGYKGLKTALSGKVIQVSEGWFDSVTLRVRGPGGNVWYVTYTREKGEERILENDSVEIYGECKGIKTYISIIGGSVTVPWIDAKYIERK